MLAQRTQSYRLENIARISRQYITDMFFDDNNGTKFGFAYNKQKLNRKKNITTKLSQMKEARQSNCLIRFDRRKIRDSTFLKSVT